MRSRLRPGNSIRWHLIPHRPATTPSPSETAYKYVFQGSAQSQDHAGQHGQASSIKDPYGNQLNFTYTGSNLTGITDNLGLSGRTGLILTYYRAIFCKDITDWSGPEMELCLRLLREPAIGHEPPPKTITVHV